MAWRDRLRDLILAGGALAIGGCGSSLPGGGEIGAGLTPCGNANPDPCICGRPDGDALRAMQCDQKMACEADGGAWDPWYTASADGAVSEPHCNPRDGGVD